MANLIDEAMLKFERTDYHFERGCSLDQNY